MEFGFTSVPYDRTLPDFPKGPAVYKVYDTQGQLIVLDKTSNLSQRLDRFFGPRSELLKDLDLREITSRIEFRRTWSPFETTYVLYLERRRLYPKTYRKMRTFRFFSLMKINRRQRFPRIYTSRQIKEGVDYFGPFVGRGQFNRLKTLLERTFKIRPCLYNIRGNDPHPDCLYFQMHTCSRPCNNDIGRADYLEDVDGAMDFIRGRDQNMTSMLLSRMSELSQEERFEEAELLRRRLEKIQNARHEVKDTFESVWSFDYLVVLPSENALKAKIAYVRAGCIVAMEDYDVSALPGALPGEVDRLYSGPLPKVNRDWHYDEFCLVSSFIVDRLKSVEVVPVSKFEDVISRIEARPKRKKKGKGDLA
jgi:excinuclease ABC subunit C